MSKTTTTPVPRTAHITRLFRTATPEQVIAGAQWYSDAHEISSTLAAKHGLTTEIVAGIFAALSPLQSYGANVNLLVRFLAAGGLHTGYLSGGLAKGRAILAGADIESTLNGDKTVNFYRSIATAGVEGVCIDRHSWSVSVNTRYTGDSPMPSLSGKRYALAVDVYKRAASILSRELGETITPAQCQAVTWSLWRAKFWAVGAFDSHETI